MIENQQTFLNSTHIPLRWVDLDAYAHLNNAKFFDAMTEARANLLGDLLMSPGICQFILAQTNCTFKIPYHYPETIVINQYCESIGSSSFSLHYIFTALNNTTSIYAEGTAKMVCFDPIEKKIVRIPQQLLQLLSPV